MKKVYVSDFTLRQSERNGSALSFREKTAMAKCLNSLGVDAVELAPVKSGREDSIVSRTLAATLKNTGVCIPAGFSEAEVDMAWSCVMEAANPCLQIIVPTSTVQMEYLYHMKAEKMCQKAAALVEYAHGKCANVELVAQDASRAERTFLIELCRAAQEKGASSVTLCDDAGIMTPQTLAQMVRDVKAAVDMPVYVSPSDAIGMAAAAAVEALEAGADGIKTTICDPQTLNIGKFADVMRVLGNDLQMECGIDMTGVHHAVAAFSHQTQAAVEPEHMPQPEQNTLALDGDSTISDVSKAAQTLGYDLSDEDTGKVYEELRRVTAQKDSVGAKELDAIIASTAMQVPSTYHVDSYVCNTGNMTTAMASVTLVREGNRSTGVSIGDGPIDASFRAIEQAIGHHYELDDFQIQAVTEGREALGSAIVKLRSAGRLYSGNGLSTDIVGASIRAFINALNKIVYEEN